MRPATTLVEPAVLRPTASARHLSISRSGFYRLKDTPGFPRPVRLTPGTVGWLRAELDAWLASQPRVAAGEADRVATASHGAA